MANDISIVLFGKFFFLRSFFLFSPPSFQSLSHLVVINAIIIRCFLLFIFICGETCVSVFNSKCRFSFGRFETGRFLAFYKIYNTFFNSLYSMWVNLRMEYLPFALSYLSHRRKFVRLHCHTHTHTCGGFLFALSFLLTGSWIVFLWLLFLSPFPNHEHMNVQSVTRAVQENMIIYWL